MREPDVTAIAHEMYELYGGPRARRDGDITAKDYADVNGVSNPTARYHLNKLVDAGKAESELVLDDGRLRRVWWVMA